jgi:hypothetical protein
VEYAKLWSITQRFLIEGSLGENLLTKIKSTSSGPEEQWGCTRSDFLNYTYLGAPEQAGSELRKIAVVMAAEQIKQDNIDEILGEIPEAMLIDFTKAVVVRIVSLPISQFIVTWRDLFFERRYDLSADFTQHTCNSVVTRKVHAIFFHFMDA